MALPEDQLLWLQIRTVPSQRCVAANILRAVRRSLLAELGHNEAAQRHDRTWASTTLCDNAEDLDLLAGLPELHADAVFESSQLVQHALLGGVLSLPDASLLQQLGVAATEHSAPARRGRAGSPRRPTSNSSPGTAPSRRVRYDAGRRCSWTGSVGTQCEERLVEDLRAFVTAHELPPMSLDEVLEEYLRQHIEDYANARDREFDESA